MLYSKSAKYAIKTLSSLANLQKAEYLTAEEVAKSQEVPAHFLSKIFQGLTKDGILESQKGRGGGFRLSDPAEDISLLEIVYSVDGDEVFDRCPFDVKRCSTEQPCPLHEDWKPIRDQIVAFLDRKSIADLTHN